jgi:UDP-glucose:(heptosyl)LPS alpha-1,3-glucosyltransferase
VKVALLIHTFTPVGGAERACLGLSRALLARGHEVHVYARQITPLPGLIPHPLPAHGLFEDTAFARESRRLLERETFDIIHSFTRTLYHDILRLGGGIHKEFLAQIAGSYGALRRFWQAVRPKERAQLRLEREGLAPGAYRKIVAVSRRVKDEARRHYGIPEGDIEVIYNGVDAGEFKPSAEARSLIRNQLGLGDADYMLLFCGTGFRRKGLDLAIAAIDRVPSARLVVAGEGRARPHPRVLYLGRRTDVSHLYAACDVFLLPTLYDPFPNAALEAMASGVPVIVSRIAGVSEIIEGDSVVVDEPRDIERLSGAIRELEDPKLRRPMGEAARLKALQFPLERVVEANLALYDQVRKAKSPDGRSP